MSDLERENRILKARIVELEGCMDQLLVDTRKKISDLHDMYLSEIEDMKNEEIPQLNMTIGYGNRVIAYKDVLGESD